MDRITNDHRKPGPLKPEVFWPYRLRTAMSKMVFRALFARAFEEFGKGSSLVQLDGVEGARFIRIGKGVLVAQRSYLAARQLSIDHAPSLTIGNGVRIGRNNHIYAVRRVAIGANVLTASNVYISDNSHSYEDINIPVRSQPLRILKDTEIGAGTWIGHNASVFGAKIGRNCVVGSGAVVIDDIPDFSVAVGAPAKVIKVFNHDRYTWEQLTQTL